MYLAEHAVKGVTVNKQNADPVDRIWTSRGEYCDALRNAGYGDLHSRKSPIVVGHILRELKPHHLHTRMTNIVERRKTENIDKENFDRFWRNVSKQAKNYKPSKGVASVRHSDRCSRA